LTKNNVWIEAENLNHLTYSIFDATGKVYDVDITYGNNKHALHTQPLPSGMYFLKFKRNEQLIVFRFVKQ